jgi:hypothetical protein
MPASLIRAIAAAQQLECCASRPLRGSGFLAAGPYRNLLPPATPKVGDQPPRRPEKIFPAGGDRPNPFAAKSRGWLLRARQSYSHPLNLRVK